MTLVDQPTGLACFVLCSNEDLEREATAASREGLTFFSNWLTENVTQIPADTVDIPTLWQLMR